MATVTPVTAIPLIAGVDFDRIDTTAQFPLGYEVADQAGARYRYSKHVAATVQYSVCVLDSTHFATKTTSVLTEKGSRIGVAQAAGAADEYGWFQVYGEGWVRVLASAAANVNLNTTATAGALDDDATTGAEVIDGIVINSTAAGSSANHNSQSTDYIVAMCTIINPRIGVTL